MPLCGIPFRVIYNKGCSNFGCGLTLYSLFLDELPKQISCTNNWDLLRWQTFSIHQSTRQYVYPWPHLPRKVIIICQVLQSGQWQSQMVWNRRQAQLLWYIPRRCMLAPKKQLGTGLRRPPEYTSPSVTSGAVVHWHGQIKSWARFRRQLQRCLGKYDTYRYSTSKMQASQKAVQHHY